MVSNIFYVHPELWGFMIQFHEHNGLKPPNKGKYCQNHVIRLWFWVNQLQKMRRFLNHGNTTPPVFFVHFSNYEKKRPPWKWWHPGRKILRCHCLEFSRQEKVEIVCFSRGGLRGGVRLIGAFSRNILELLLLSDFLMIWFLRFKKVPNSHVFIF